MPSSLLLLALACTSKSEPEPSSDPEPVENLAAELVTGSESVIRLCWDQSVEGVTHIEFQVDGGDWQQTPEASSAPGEVTQYILGVPYDAEVSYQVVLEDETSRWTTKLETIQTGELPTLLPIPSLIVSEPTLWDPSVRYLLASIHTKPADWGTTWWVFIIDRSGEVVWALESKVDGAGYRWVSRHITVRHEGDGLLIDRATAWTNFDDGADSTVAWMTLDGSIHHIYQTPGLHHPFTSLPDGVVAWAARNLEHGTTETIELVDLDGTQEQIWRCLDFHDLIRDLDGELCGSNTLWWDPSTDRFLFSFWSTETIVEVERQSGALVRWFGQANGSWGFSPEESAFWWQHGPSFTADGTLLVSSKDEQGGDETVVREYTLDSDTETLVEVWSAGQDRAVYAKYGGDAHRLPNGNTLHGYGSAGHIVEFTPAGEVAWELSWSGARRIGQTTPLADLYPLLP